MLIGLAIRAPCQAQDEISSAERCLAANLDVSLGAHLPRTAARLKSGEPLKIVAIGSSSTVGLWVLRSAATYPEVMRRELSRLRSNATINVINSGRIGDTIPSSGIAQSALVTWDGLHNTADVYDCVGRALARAISTSAR